MPEPQISNYCDLFGFNSKKYPVSRLPIKIGSEIYPSGFEFIHGTTYSGYDIANHIDDLALIYFDNDKHLVLHMFVPEGTAQKTFINCTPERKLYRYSKYKHNKNAYEYGQFQVSPALEYLKKEYDEARKDNEQIHQKNVSPDKVKMSSMKNGATINPIGDIIYSTILLPIDCYILCFSYDYDKNLYDEFKGSDSCLIINDVTLFAERIYTAFQKALPDYTGIDARVTYSKHLNHLGILFSKTKRHINQRECRFAWLPNNSKHLINPMQLLENDIDEIKKMLPDPIKLSIGSLEDISEIRVRQ